MAERSTCLRPRVLAGLLIVTLLSGCAQTRSWLDRVTPGRSADAGGGRDTAILGAPSAEDYLRELDLVATGDPATQIEIVADAESRATLTPNPSTQLRYGLILATPGHSESDPEKAQSILRELLTRPELLTPAEVALAHIHLENVEERIVLMAEARRLRQSSSRQARTQELAINQRLAAVEAENRQLRRDLADAESKLEAITSIERSIREQEQ